MQHCGAQRSDWQLPGSKAQPLLLCAAVLQDELKNLMAIADVDGDGLIDYNEFVAATMHVSKLEKEELLQKVRPAALVLHCQLRSHMAGTCTVRAGAG